MFRLGYIELPIHEIFGFKIQFFITLSATVWCLLVSAFRTDITMDLKGIWEAILTGANNTLIIGATLGVIGIIVGTISLTGIGLKFSDIIISLASGNLLAAIFLVALASLVLGMGVPVTAAYLITAVLAVPPLMEMGVPAALRSHDRLLVQPGFEHNPTGLRCGLRRSCDCRV